MTKIDKTLREVRGWKRKVSARTKKMKPAEVVTYFRAASRAAKEAASASHTRRRA